MRTDRHIDNRVEPRTGRARRVLQALERLPDTARVQGRRMFIREDELDAEQTLDAYLALERDGGYTHATRLVLEASRVVWDRRPTGWDWHRLLTDIENGLGASAPAR